MRGRRRSVAGCAASFALLAGCGGSDVDEEEYLGRGNQICVQLAGDFAELGPPPDQRTPARARWELRVDQLGQAAFDELADLEPPDELREGRDALFAAVGENRRHVQRLRTVTRALERELRQDVTDGPAQSEFQDLTALVQQDSVEIASRLRSLGLTECAALSGA